MDKETRKPTLLPIILCDNGFDPIKALKEGAKSKIEYNYPKEAYEVFIEGPWWICGWFKQWYNTGGPFKTNREAEDFLYAMKIKERNY